jgi:Kef-type K+ transport system membrane component KefB
MKAEALVAKLLLDLAVIMLAAQLLRAVLGRIHQPRALAEILAGLALGPSLLGRLPGNPTAALFPGQVRPALSLIGTLGLVMFAFVLGMQIDHHAIRARARSIATVSAGAVALPFAAGALLAVWLHSSHHWAHGHQVAALPFTLFVATAMSVTAFPVLAAILVERGIRRTPLGELALSSAALQDAIGWLLLAVALATLSARASGSVARVTLGTAGFLLALACARPLLRALLARRRSNHGAGQIERLAIAATTAVLCAAATQAIGIHQVVGAFAAGVAFPRETSDHQRQPGLGESIMPITLAVLLPVYFVTAGLQVNIATVGPKGVLEFAAIMVAACVTKLLGTALPARAAGIKWAEARPLAVLLNTRGLMELVVLSVGYSEGVLDQRLYTELVLMAVATTMLTGPLLNLLARHGLSSDPVNAQATHGPDYRGHPPLADPDGAANVAI